MRGLTLRQLRILVVLPLLVSCGVGVCTPSFEAIPAQVTGGVIAPRADGVEVECRGVEPERCRSSADGIVEALGPEDAERIIVSCVGRCNAQGGELRMDTVVGDRTTLIANGGYGEFEESCG